jgi:hypothetical protein
MRWSIMMNKREVVFRGHQAASKRPSERENSYNLRRERPVQKLKRSVRIGEPALCASTPLKAATSPRKGLQRPFSLLNTHHYALAYLFAQDPSITSQAGLPLHVFGQQRPFPSWR